MTESTLPVVNRTRRMLCAHGCLSAAAVALGALSNACGGGGSSSPTSPGGSGDTGAPLTNVDATVSGRTISVPVDNSPLATIGGAALVRTPIGTYLVARTGQGSFSALTAVCTHEMNTVSNFTGSQFACTFHGSLYTTTGAVVRGPATRPLTAYPTSFAGNIVSFDV